MCFLLFEVRTGFTFKGMADENENSAASGKLLFKFKAAGDKNCVDNAITENSKPSIYNGRVAIAAVSRSRNAHVRYL